MPRTFSTPQEAAEAILDEVRKVRNMVGYTGEGMPDECPASYWMGANLHRIEDAALFLTLSVNRIPR
jgi:hypothetical protein